MGSGDRQQQFERRFDQGNSHAEHLTLGQECGKPEGLPIILGNYRIVSADQGYLLLHNEQELGKYRELLRADENRALLKLEKGMLLEVTSTGTRETLTEEKARVHGIIASDGSLYHSPEQHIYEIKVACESRELIDMFREDFKKVYDQDLHFSIERGKYPKARISSKDSFNDLAAYGAKEGKGLWRVPREHLDREGAREWLKMFMAGDGSIGCERGKPRVRFFSSNLSGLEQIQQLLSEEFGIVSKMSSRDRRGNGRHEKIEYVLEVEKGDQAARYIMEVGSYNKSHQEKIRAVVGDV